MEKQVIDITTGIVEVIPFTAEEEAKFIAGLEPLPPAPSPPTLSDLQAQLAAIQAQISELANGSTS